MTASDAPHPSARRLSSPSSTLVRGLGWVAAFVLLAWTTLVSGCAPQAGGASTEEITPARLDGRPLQVVATTNLIGDLVRELAGDRVELKTLMGPGVDPHLYQASEGDVRRLAEAHLVLYNGLDLEGKMTDVFAQMQRRGIPTVAVAAEALPDSAMIESEEYVGNFDPHVWFDVALWSRVARYVGDVLAQRDTAHAATYREKADRYAQRLAQLDAYVTEQAERLPDEQRVLITSHDAFSYFGRGYGFEVIGLQGISTTSEAGAADVQNLAATIVERRIPALFAETSVSPRGIQAVRQAVRAQGFDVDIGGTLYGDALGDPGTPTGSYIGAVRHNIDTVLSGLLRQAPSTSAAAR